MCIRDSREALGRSCQACSILPAQLGEAIGDMAALSVGIDAVLNG